MQDVSGKIAVLVAVAVTAAASVVIMWALGWTQKGTLGLDIVLWGITWFLGFTAYAGLPGDVPAARRTVGVAAILVLGLIFTYVFKALTPEIVGGSVDDYPLMSLTYVAWVLVFLMLGIWLRQFWRAL